MSSAAAICCSIGFLFHLLDINPAPIIRDFDDHLVAVVIGVKANGALRGLAGFLAVCGAFDAVSDSVAHEVRQRFGDGVENAFVEIGIFSADDEIDLTIALLGHVAHHARKAAEQLLDWDHADLHHRTLQIVQHARLEGHGVGEFSADGFLGIDTREFVQRLLQHRLTDDQLADQVQDVVNALGVDTENVFRGGERSLRASFRLGLFTGDCGGRKNGRLREFFHRNFGKHFLRGGLFAGDLSLQRFYFDMSDDSRNLALTGDGLGGFVAGQQKFQALRALGRTVFRTRGEDLAGRGETVEYQLTRGDRHGAVRVDLRGDMKDALAAAEGGLHGQFFVFSPDGGGHRSLRFFLAALSGSG